jgi:hypothetical protein
LVLVRIFFGEQNFTKFLGLARNKVLFTSFIYRHIMRHWGMNLAVLFGLTLGAGLLGSLPSFAATTAIKSLDASLGNSHPSVRNILVTGIPASLTSSLNSLINENLGNLVKERMSIGNIRLPANPSIPIIINQEERSSGLNEIWIWSFDKLSQHATLLHGDWPAMTYPRTQAEALTPPTIQAAITEDVANDLGVQPGDQIQDVNKFKYFITGIFKRDDPNNDIWWQDSDPFIITREPGINEDNVVVPILINPQSLNEYHSSHRSEWRYILNQGEINIDNAESIGSQLINLKNRLTAYRADMNTGLPNLILEYSQNLSISRMVLYLLSSQASLFIVFTLILMASFLVTNSHNELVTMSNRGASRYQIIVTFAIQLLVLALFAGLILGPLMKFLGMSLWEWISGERTPNKLPPETWRMSLLAVSIGWFAILLAIIPATRRKEVESQSRNEHPNKATGWQKSYLDIFLLIAGVLLFWQLSDSGTFVMKRVQGTSLADPLLLLGPPILLIALAMVFLRLFPFLMQGLSSIVKTRPGLVFPIGVTRIARNPQRLSWIILLVSLAVALTLFTKIYTEALNSTQMEIAKYETGSDIRIDLDKISPDDLFAISDDISISPVMRGIAQTTSGSGITVLAVDPDSFAKVAKYPEGMSNLTIDLIMQALKVQPLQTSNSHQESTKNPYTDQRDSSEVIPAIFSYSSIPRDGNIGDRQDFYLAGQPVTFEMIAGPSITGQLRRKEAWISTENVNHDEIVSSPYLANAILADAQRSLDLFRNNILTLGTVRAFALNAIILAILSLVGLILANYFSLRQRAYEFGILHSFGLSRNQANRLLIGEGILALGLGILSGLILGYGLTKLMRPYLSLVVSRTLPGLTVHQVTVNLESVALVAALMIVFYSTATAIILIALWRSEPHQILRVGDE